MILGQKQAPDNRKDHPFTNPVLLRDPNRLAARSVTEGFDRRSTPGEGSPEWRLVEAEDGVHLRVRTRDPELAGRLVSYELHGAGDAVLQGFLVLQPDINGWLAARTRFDLGELFRHLRGECHRVVACLAELPLLPEDRGILVASLERDKDTEQKALLQQFLKRAAD